MGRGGNRTGDGSGGSAWKDLSSPSSQSKSAVVFRTALNTEIFRGGGERGASVPPVNKLRTFRGSQAAEGV